MMELTLLDSASSPIPVTTHSLPPFALLSVHWLQESSGGNPKTDSVHTKPCRKEEFQMCSKQNSQKHRGSSAITSWLNYWCPQMAKKGHQAALSGSLSNRSCLERWCVSHLWMGKCVKCWEISKQQISHAFKLIWTTECLSTLSGGCILAKPLFLESGGLR